MFLLRLIVLFAITRLATRSTPMTDTTTDNGTTEPVELGDIVHTDPNPILDDTDNLDRLEVLVNWTYARQPNGHYAIRIQASDGRRLLISAAQADELARDLATIAPVIAAIRADIGANS